MVKTIAVVATLDTRGDEALFLKEQIEKKGCKTIVIDPGIMGEPYFKADVSRNEVAKAAGTTLEKLVEDALKGASRGSGMDAMSNGLSKIVTELYARRKIDGIIGLGGGTGTRLGTEAMKQLPIGVPKLMVATHPDKHHFGIKDITMMQSVVDLVGMNKIIRTILTNAAAAIVGMTQGGGAFERGSKPMVGISCWGVVTLGAMNISNLLQKKGYEPVLFHGATDPLEDMLERKWISGVVDLCSQEMIALYVLPGYAQYSHVRRDRLEAAGKQRIPWIFTPGTLDSAFFPVTDPRFKDRKMTAHSPGYYLVRTTKEEMAALGKGVAEKANRAKGPVAVAVPTRGFSANNREGLPIYDPEADGAFTEAVKKYANKNVKIVEIDSHINDKRYAEVVVDLIDKMFKGMKSKKQLD